MIYSEVLDDVPKNVNTTIQVMMNMNMCISSLYQLSQPIVKEGIK